MLQGSLEASSLKLNSFRPRTERIHRLWRGVVPIRTLIQKWVFLFIQLMSSTWAARMTFAPDSANEHALPALFVRNRCIAAAASPF
jgi:hypothetical protein